MILAIGSLAGQNKGGGGAAVSRRGGSPAARARGGGERGDRRGPVGGLGARGGGLWRRLHGGRRAAAVLCRCGGVPARRGGDGRVRELCWDEIKRIWGLVEGGASSVDGSAWRCGRRPWQAWRRGKTARRARQQRAEGEGVRVANEKASSREFGSRRCGARTAPWPTWPR